MYVKILVEVKNQIELPMVEGDDDNTRDPDYWMSRLNQLRLKANLKPYTDDEDSADIINMDNRSLDENYKLNKVKAEKMQEASKEVS